MENNFDLRKFLVENKLTSTSRTINEQTIPNDIVWTDEDEQTASQGTFNQMDQSSDDLEGYDVELLGYSPSTGKAYKGYAGGSYGETDYDDIDGVEEMNPRETEHYIAALKKHEPEHFNKMTQGVDISKNNLSEEDKVSSRVDKGSISIANIDTSDYPDFSDAYIEYAEFEDGTPLTDEEIDQLNDEMSDEIHQLAYESLYEGLTKRERVVKEAVLKALK